MDKVITYQLAYRLSSTVDLCPACVERGNHEQGALGPVSHGLHRGECEGRHHGAQQSPQLGDRVRGRTLGRSLTSDGEIVEGTLGDCGPDQPVIVTDDGLRWQVRRDTIEGVEVQP